MNKKIAMVFTLVWVMTAILGDIPMENAILGKNANIAYAENIAYTSGDFSYSINDDGTAEISSYRGKSKKVTIPSEIDGKSVTSIHAAAFSGYEKLKSITLPNSLISIGPDAFNWCRGLTSIKIPSNVKEIDGSAFCHCDNLKKIEVDKDNLYFSAIDGSLYNKKGTKLLWVSITKKGEFHIPKKVTAIGDSAFMFCFYLTKITLPDKVTSIGSEAFYCCSDLTGVIIPKNVTSIGDNSFSECGNLTSIKVAKGNKQFVVKNGVLYSNKGTKLLWIPKRTRGAFSIAKNVTEIGGGAFFNCRNINRITIPNSVTSIGAEAFLCCGINKISIPNSVKNIGNSTFSGCRELTSITLSNKLTKIESSTFNNCTKLTKITIPNKVTVIDSWAFTNCINLTNITIPESVTSINEYAFYGCDKLTIYCTSDSAAEQYAKDNNIAYKIK